MLKRIIGCLIILMGLPNILCCLTADASDSSPHQLESNKIIFEHLTVQEGLSSNNVSAVLQDHQGFMWIGTTNSGLNKYDGVEFTNYRNDPNTPESLPNNYVWRLYQDKKGAMWIATWGGGISRFDPVSEKFINFQHDENDQNSLSSNLVWCIFESNDGMLWVGTDNGLDRYDPEKKIFTHYRHDPDDPNSISSNKVTSVMEDADGSLWVSTYGGGLNKFDPRQNRFVHYRQGNNIPSLNNDFIWNLHQDKDGTLWIGHEEGLDRFDPVLKTFVHYQNDKKNPKSISGAPVTFIFRDSREQLWVGTNGFGLNLFDPETQTFSRIQHIHNNPHSLADETVWGICEDTTGALWIATFNGVDRYDNSYSRFIGYQNNLKTPDSALSVDQIQSIYNAQNGIIWIGTRGDGLVRYDTVSKTLRHFRHDPDNPASISNNTVFDIVGSADGDIWVGTNAGLDRFDSHNASFTHYRHISGNPNSLSHGAVWDMEFTPDGSLWVGLYGGGLDKFDIKTGTFTHFMPDQDRKNTLVSEWVTAVFSDSSGLLWIGTESGLSRFNPETKIFTNFLPNADDPQSISDSMIYTIWQDELNTIWIGTNNGLNRFDRETKTFTTYGVAHGLAGSMVASMINDHQGNLWIGTNNGLSRFNLKNEKFRNYDARDGLQSNHFLRHSVSMGDSGCLLFGGTKGLISFYPENITDNPYIPSVKLTAFNLFNKPVAIGSTSPLTRHINVAEQITLSHDQSVFSFEFAALNYHFPQKNQYAYRMEGFDKDWTYVDSDRRFATYTNLDPGTYRFRVKASNNDGVWNEEGTSLKIIVTPPFWRTWWFFTLIGIVFLFTGFRVYRIRTKKMRKKNLVLEEHNLQLNEQIQERRQIETQLHHQACLQELLMNMSTTYINLPLEKVDTSICDSLQETGAFVGAGRAFIYDYDFPKQTASMTREWCAEGVTSLFSDNQKIPLSEVPAWDLEKHLRGEPIWIPDVSSLPQGKLRTMLEAGDTKASLSYPLMVSGECIGFVGFSWIKQLHALSVNEHRLLTVFATMLVNIRQRKLAEEETKTQAKTLDVIFNSAPNILLLVNAHGRIEKINHKGVEFSGHKGRELTGLLGGEALNCIHSFDGNGCGRNLECFNCPVRKRVTSTFETGKPIIEEEGRMTFLIHGKETTLDLLISTKMVTLQGENQVLLSLVDITKLKQAEREKADLESKMGQIQKMESIGNLAGGIAHDFNNLLFPIIGMSEMLLEDLPQNSVERENVNVIYKAGKRGGDLVQQILAFSRQSEHKKIPVRVQKILKEVLKLSRATIPSDITLAQDIDYECGLVMADPTQLHQIAMNLITNAYHAIDQTGGQIHVKLKERYLKANEIEETNLDPGRYAELAISDTGTGIEPAILNKIFEPYFTTKEKGKGTGLGLAVVYGIIKDHKGDIKVSSEIGKGTTFLVCLPLVEDDTKSIGIKVPESVPSGTERILLVDDEAPIVHLEKLMLERLGYKVTERNSSLDALKAFKANPSSFDLVISDMAMPNMTGDQLAREIIAIRSDIPIVIFTGYSERINKDKAHKIGIKAFLMKPVVKSDMAKVIRKVLDEAKIS